MRRRFRRAAAGLKGFCSGGGRRAGSGRAGLGDDPARAEAQRRDADAALNIAPLSRRLQLHWFYDRLARSTAGRARHSQPSRGGRVMQTDYAGQTVAIVGSDRRHPAGANLRGRAGRVILHLAHASFSQKLPDWIEGQCRALSFFGGVPKAIVCDNLKAGVVKALWFEPTLNQTFAAMAEHYDTTILPTRSRKPRDKGKVEGAVLIVERSGPAAQQALLQPCRSECRHLVAARGSEQELLEIIRAKVEQGVNVVLTHDGLSAGFELSASGNACR